jgi:hypothetical protein
MEFKDYYQILGVPRDATADEIKKAFRKLARKYHPDVSKEVDAEARMKELNEANAVLSDPRNGLPTISWGAATSLDRNSARRPTGMPASSFPGAVLRPARQPISRISSPNCSVAWVARAASAPANGRTSRRAARIITPRCCSTSKTPLPAPPGRSPARAADRRAGARDAGHADAERQDPARRARRPDHSPGRSGRTGHRWARRPAT